MIKKLIPLLVLLFVLWMLSIPVALSVEESWRTCYLDEPCMIGDHVYNDTWDPYTTQICTVNISFPNGTMAITDADMDNNSLGWHNYSYTPPVGGFYPVEMYCTNGADEGREDRSFTVRELEKGGSGMQTEIYMLFLVIAFLAAYTGIRREEPISMFAAGLFFILAAVESIGVTKLSAGAEYTYSYTNYIFLWGGFSVLALILAVFFVVENKGFKPMGP